MKKVHPQVLFLCSMFGIGNERLEQLAFDTCHSIDLTCDYPPNSYKLVRKQLHYNVMPRIQAIRLGRGWGGGGGISPG